MATKKSSGSSLLPWLGIALIIILLDQISKVVVLGAFELNDSRPLTSFFNLVRVHNHGAAFSFLASAGGWQRWFFVGLGTVAVGFIVYMLREHGHQKMFSWALTLIMGGAIGNVIDRWCMAMWSISLTSTGPFWRPCSRRGTSRPSTSPIAASPSVRPCSSSMS